MPSKRRSQSGRDDEEMPSDDEVASRRAELHLREANARYDLVGRSQADLDRARRERDRIAELHSRGVASQRALYTVHRNTLS